MEKVKPNTELLESTIRESWDSNTSASSLWNEKNPALGQSDVTALVIQDYLKGKLKCVEVLNFPGIRSHYYNELPDLKTLDLTKEQFPEGTKFGEPQDITRDHVLSLPDITVRYDVLRNRVAVLIRR